MHRCQTYWALSWRLCNTRPVNTEQRKAIRITGHTLLSLQHSSLSGWHASQSSLASTRQKGDAIIGVAVEASQGQANGVRRTQSQTDAMREL